MEKTRKHILDLESQRIEQERLSNTLRMEKEASNQELDELRAELDRHKKGTDAETELSKVQQNYQIMKDAYAKMRGEHLELIRLVCSFLHSFFPHPSLLSKPVLMFSHHAFFMHFPSSSFLQKGKKMLEEEQHDQKNNFTESVSNGSGIKRGFRVNDEKVLI